MLVLKERAVVIDLSDVDLASLPAGTKIRIILPEWQKVAVDAPQCIPVRRASVIRREEVRRGHA